MTTRAIHALEEVPLGDVVTAMDFIDVMGHHGWERPPEELMAALWERSDPQELLQGFGTLIYFFMSVISPRCLDDEAVSEVVPAVLVQLRRFSDIPSTVIPTMAAVLTAAALDQHPCTWRGKLDSVEHAESVAWSYTSWLLAEFIDLHQGRGTVSTLMTETFAGMWHSMSHSAV